jgi:UrcA family protein
MHVSTPMFAAALVLAALSFGAHADTSSPSTVIRGRTVVSFGDLDIDTEQDAKILLQRIERAAKRACGGHATFSSYTGSLDHTFEECRSEAIQRTVRQLGAPMVTRIYSEAIHWRERATGGEVKAGRLRGSSFPTAIPKRDGNMSW